MKLRKKRGRLVFARQAHEGFTLIELLLYMGLLAIFLTSLTGIFASALDVSLSSQATSAVDREAKFIFLRLAHDLAQATLVTSPGLGDSGSTLTFAGLDGNYTYALVDENLVLSKGGMAENLNSSETRVASVLFTRLGKTGGKGSLRVRIDLESRTLVSGVPETKTLETTLGLR